MSTITVGTWVYYCGTHAGLHGQLLEVVAVNSDRLTLRGPLFRVHCRASSVRVVQPAAWPALARSAAAVDSEVAAAGCTIQQRQEEALSTNYYVRTPDGQEIHLGKFAQGQPFMFRGYPERGVVDLATWRAQLTRGQVHTECGTPITPERMEDVIDDARRQGYRWHPLHGDQHDDEHGNRFTNREFC